MTAGLSLAQDAAFPQAAPLQPGVIVSCGYIGGDAEHVWTAADWATWGTRYRVPTWVRSDPDITSPFADAAACAAALEAIGAPRPYFTAPYGSSSSLFDNPVCAGYWVADPDGNPSLAGQPGGTIAKQFEGGNGFDLSVIDQAVAVWDTQAGTGPTLVMLDLETAEAPAWVAAFAIALAATEDDTMIATGQYSDGRMIIALTGTDGNVYVTEQQTPGGGWTGMQGGSGLAQAGAGPVPAALAGGVTVALELVADVPSVFIQSASPAASGNGDVFTSWESPPGTWAPWTQIT